MSGESTSGLLRLPVQRGSRLAAQVRIGARPMPELLECPSMDLKRRSIGKASGGLWTSSLQLRPGRRPACDWARWCLDEQFLEPYGLPWWRLLPESAADLIVIRSLADLQTVVARFPHSRYGSRLGSAGYPLGFDDREIDFCAAVTAGFAGLHLTRRGMWETRLSHPLDLYTWDCESTWWGRWAFAGEPELVWPGLRGEGPEPE